MFVRELAVLALATVELGEPWLAPKRLIVGFLLHYKPSGVAYWMLPTGNCLLRVAFKHFKVAIQSRAILLWQGASRLACRLIRLPVDSICLFLIRIAQ